jgi:cardiolipin synthase
LLLRDNLRNRARIERAYRQAIGTARNEIIIANAYFLPGRRLRSALFHARRRGVRVQLLLQGRYDNFMQFHASRPVMASLLAAGIEVYEYSASLLHAKVAVIDGEWATVGSSNLDPLSLLLAREANVVWTHEALAGELRSHLVHAMEHSATPLDATRLSQRSLWHRALDRLAFALMRTMLFVTGFRY